MEQGHEREEEESMGARHDDLRRAVYQQIRGASTERTGSRPFLEPAV
jgi:hypothetical protein